MPRERANHLLTPSAIVVKIDSRASDWPSIVKCNLLILPGRRILFLLHPASLWLALFCPQSNFSQLLGKKKRRRPYCLCPLNSILGRSSSPLTPPPPPLPLSILLAFPFAAFSSSPLSLSSRMSQVAQLPVLISAENEQQVTLLSYECRAHTNRSIHSGVFLPIWSGWEGTIGGGSSMGCAGGCYCGIAHR